MKILIVALVTTLAMNGNAFADGSTSNALGSAKFWQLVNDVHQGQIIKAACCKTCRKGKACGDSCISKSKTCRKGRGCACDG